jgi:signal transduction histidine kinase
MSHPATPPTVEVEAILDAQKRSFLRMVSHELRTPLNSILGFSEILSTELYGPLGAPQYKDYAEIIHQSGAKLLKLVNQVLEIARLDGRTLDFETRPESVELAVDDVLETLRADLAARRVTVVVAGRDTLPTVAADPRGLRTVLVNLLQNAVNVTPENGVVQVSACVRGETVEIEIQDHGPGIDQADIPRLMAPFEQAEATLTRHSEGAGLGLPICDLTCRAMAGQLRLTPSTGGGLTALVILPAA